MTESQRIEYKRELTANLEKEVVAFLNARDGGMIFIGIDDTGRAVGLSNCDQVQLIVKDRLKNNIQPSVMGLFDVAHEQRDGQDVVCLTIACGPEKPYYLKKYGMTERGCFLRVGSSTEPMPQDMIDSLYSRRVRNSIGRMESTRLGLTFEQLKIYYEARGLKLNAAFMTNLELLTPEGKANYAAYLPADDNGISVQVAKYADKTRVNLLENIDFGRCSLIKSYKSVMDRLNVENTIFTRIGVPLREERPMINPVAMREAVVNAIVHNDYANGSCPKFEFFSDRLEITSAGGLPYGLSQEDFFAGHSAPRNKEIMRVFRDLDIVEHLGSGIPRILEVYGQESFQISPNFMRLVFPYTSPIQNAVSTTSGAESGVESGAESRAESGRTSQVITVLLEGTHSKLELAQALGKEKPSGYLNKTVKQLLELGYIEYTLPDKPNSRLQKYRLTGKGQALHVSRAGSVENNSTMPLEGESGVESGAESGAESNRAGQILRLLQSGSHSKQELAHALGKEKPYRYLNELVKHLLSLGYIEYTLPDKPISRLQKYRLTAKGRALIEQKNADV